MMLFCTHIFPFSIVAEMSSQGVCVGKQPSRPVKNFVNRGFLTLVAVVHHEHYRTSGKLGLGLSPQLLFTCTVHSWRFVPTGGNTTQASEWCADDAGHDAWSMPSFWSRLEDDASCWLFCFDISTALSWPPPKTQQHKFKAKSQQHARSLVK